MISNTMFTTGSKLFFGTAVFASVAAIIYMVQTENELVGSILLWTLAGVAIFLGGMTIAFRDAEFDVPAVQASSAADAEGRYTGGPRVSNSMWPLVAGFGVAVLAIGTVHDRRLALLGAVTLLAAVIEWMVQAWADRASDDPAYNARQRARIMHPLEFPVFGAIVAGFVIWGFSRLMLAVTKEASTWLFIGVGVVILIGAVIVASREPGRSSANLVSGFLVLGGAAILSAGIIGVAAGERSFEQHGEGHSESSTNAVADKAALAATVEFDGQDELADLSIPSALWAGVLFRNEQAEVVRLEFDAGESTTTDAEGNEVTEEVVYETGPAAEGKEQYVTVRFPRRGFYEYRVVAVESGEALATGTVAVP